VKPPARAVVGQLIWSADGGVWGLWRVRPFPHAYTAGSDITQLLEVMDRGECPCGDTESVPRGRLAEINEEIAGLARLRDELARLLDAHPATSCPGSDPDTWWCRNDFTGRR
jgi:hypothetical protein